MAIVKSYDISPADLVISQFGVRPLSRELGLSPSSVQRWRESGRVPQHHFQKIVSLSKDSDDPITLHDLINGRSV